jgi:hypothetical protein
MKTTFKKSVNILIGNLSFEISQTLMFYPFKMLLQTLKLEKSLVIYMKDISGAFDEYKMALRHNKNLATLAKKTIEETFHIKMDENLYGIKKEFLAWLGKIF